MIERIISALITMGQVVFFANFTKKMVISVITLVTDGLKYQNYKLWC